MLVDIASGTTVRKYFGLQQSDYQINSCFGGANEQFILSGSEGAFIHHCSFSLLTLESSIRVFGTLIFYSIYIYLLAPSFGP